MNKLYLITGPAGVGKTTVSTELAKRFKKSALIEGDTIYAFVVGGHVSPWLEGNQLDIFWENVYYLIENFLSHGYDVIFNYIIKDEIFEKLKKKFINPISNRGIHLAWEPLIPIMLSKLKKYNIKEKYKVDLKKSQEEYLKNKIVIIKNKIEKNKKIKSN